MAAIPDALSKVFSRIDDEQERFIADLAEAVKIKSVSAWIQNREVQDELAKYYLFLSPFWMTNFHIHRLVMSASIHHVFRVSCKFIGTQSSIAI